MRLYEFAKPIVLTERMLEENFLDSIKNFIKGQATSGINAVRDAVGAAEVMYKVIRDHKTLISVIHELKEEVIGTVAGIAKLPIISKVGTVFSRFAQYVRKLISTGYGVRDFLLSLGLITIVNMLKKTAVSDAVGAVKDYLLAFTVKMSQLAKMVVDTLEVAGFFAIISDLELADDLLFDTLNKINKKISSPNYQQYDPTVAPLLPSDQKLWQQALTAVTQQQPNFDPNNPHRAKEIADRYEAMGGTWA
jgi:hypothetical protein